VQSLSTIIATFNGQIAALEKQVTACFGRTRDAEIYLSQPGLGQILAARILGEFGDDPERYASAQGAQELRPHQPNYPAVGQEEGRTGPLHPQRPARRPATPAGVLCAERFARRPRVLRPAAPRNISHHATLRQLSNRLVGILHGSLKSRTLYDEHTAWEHHVNDQQAAG
jgi:hypothetical protein